MKQGIRIFFLIISLLCGGFVVHDKLTVGFWLLSYYLSILFVFSSIVTSLLQTKSKIRYIPKRLSGFYVWAILISMTIGSLFLINKLRKLSPVVFSTKFYWEEGVDVEFRRNGTYKALNHHMFGGDISYGKYKLKDSLIILEDKLKFGMSNMKDTLIVSNDGISFTLEKPWRINEGKMSFEYMPKTEVKILNNTNNNIDSITIKLSYTKQISKTVLIGPEQNVIYEFDMTNPYVDGKYILLYRIKTLSSEIKKIRNILNGYPLETVESIRFEEEKIVISLIFGKEISLTYT